MLLLAATLHRATHGRDTRAPDLTHDHHPCPSREPNKTPQQTQQGCPRLYPPLLSAAHLNNQPAKPAANALHGCHPSVFSPQSSSPACCPQASIPLALLPTSFPSPLVLYSGPRSQPGPWADVWTGLVLLTLGPLQDTTLYGLPSSQIKAGRGPSLVVREGAWVHLRAMLSNPRQGAASRGRPDKHTATRAGLLVSGLSVRAQESRQVWCRFFTADPPFWDLPLPLRTRRRMKLAVLTTACALGGAGCQAPRVLSSHRLVPPARKILSCPQLTGKERLSMSAGRQWPVCP